MQLARAEMGLGSGDLVLVTLSDLEDSNTKVFLAFFFFPVIVIVLQRVWWSFQ